MHRDLKPANVKLRPNGLVKVLDFGLAKTIESAAAMSPSVSMSPTITTPAMTQAGIILEISPHGLLQFVGYERDNVWRLFVRALDEIEAKPLAGTEWPTGSFFWSPDSRQLAFCSAGKLKKIYVRPFVPPSARAPSALDGKQTISRGGVDELVGRSADRKELWYFTSDLKMWAVGLTMTPTFRAGEPTLLFQMPAEMRAAATDGKRFLLSVASERSRRVPISVVVKWLVLADRQPR